MRKLFLREALPGNTGAIDVKHPEWGERREQMRCQKSCSKRTEFCVVPAGMQGLECALSCGCCFRGQSEYTEVQAGLAQAKE